MTAALRRLSLVDDASETDAPICGPKLKIAIATRDMKGLNAHFGSAPKFAVYEVSQTRWRFLEALDFSDFSLSDESGRHAEDGDDRITPKVEALTGCHLLFVLAIGGPSAVKVVRAGIHPVKLPQAQPIEDVLARVQTMLAGSPPPWLRKILGPAETDMSFLEEEDA